MLCLKEKKGDGGVSKLASSMPYLSYCTTQLSSLKELCGIEASVSYSLEVLLTRTEAAGYCHRISRHKEGPKNDVGRSGCPKPPFAGSSHDKK